jgi:5-methyltetrahydropteroyltriglutamate--homocysteine methyltransferase
VSGTDSRIRTTHAGSLPRTEALVRAMIAKSRREALDEDALRGQIAASLRHVVTRQLEVGIDVANDGEQSRESFFTYVQHRLSGYSGESDRPVMRDLVAFPSFVESHLPKVVGKPMVNLLRAPKATGAVRHLGLEPLRAEIAAFRAALGDRRFEDVFWTAATPGIVASAMLDEHYGSYERYVDALAEALRPEYAAIVGEGFVLQLDAPDLAMERHTSFADRPLADFLRFVETNLAAIDRATAGLPRERIRLHVCWGNYEGPHHLDVAMEEILGLVFRARVGAFSLPFANPRHAHEWRVLERLRLPEDASIVAGVIDTTTNYVEHAELVAERLENVARALGDPERVVAGTDCGFGTAAGLGEVAEEIVWEKLRALRAGADLTSRRLFG